MPGSLCSAQMSVLNAVHGMRLQDDVASWGKSGGGPFVIGCVVALCTRIGSQSEAVVNRCL